VLAGLVVLAAGGRRTAARRLEPELALA
jgi:hypothetical protein